MNWSVIFVLVMNFVAMITLTWYNKNIPSIYVRLLLAWTLWMNIVLIALLAITVDALLKRV